MTDRPNRTVNEIADDIKAVLRDIAISDSHMTDMAGTLISLRVIEKAFDALGEPRAPMPATQLMKIYRDRFKGRSDAGGIAYSTMLAAIEDAKLVVVDYTESTFGIITLTESGRVAADTMQAGIEEGDRGDEFAERFRRSASRYATTTIGTRHRN
jgi:hypothetical protein